MEGFTVRWGKVRERVAETKTEVQEREREQAPAYEQERAPGQTQ